MDPDNNTITTNNNDSSSSEECVVLSTNSPTRVSSTETDTAKTPTTPKLRLSKTEYMQRKSEREAKKAEEQAIKAEKKRLAEELKAKKAAELQLEKARKAEELQLEKARKAEEKARKAEELQLEKARKAEELQLEKARKAEELQLEKARKAEEKARKEAENANKKAEQIQKKEQRQAQAQKQELVHKQMATYMDRYFKPVDKPSQKEGQTSTTNTHTIVQRCTNIFDQLVSKQDVNFVSDIIENIKSMKKLDIEINSRPRLNSDSNSSLITIIATTTANNSYVLKTRYIHFPEKYFNRPPYYGTFKKALSVNVNPLEPDASIENVDYTVDSEGEWEELCKDGEELRSDADDLSDSETMDSESDTDSFIVPHGHLSDDELNEDEQQQSTSTKQAREAAKTHVWDKKVARLNQQRELKPLFGCIYDPTLDEKTRFELSNYLHQFQRILVPKEILQRVEQDDKEQEINDDTISKEDKKKGVSRKKSLVSKKGSTTDQQQPVTNTPSIGTPTVKRTGSVSNIVEAASPSKRRKMNSNENCSIIDDSDVIMTDIEVMNTSKTNVLEDASNVSDIKSSPLTIISNDDVKLDSTPICTLLVPKRKQPPA
ncbi:unnamed protein product [Rotaria sp. Silwood1]|nr:unnamed protein product [Rotaria sp. Silwood1]CAF3591704.1 unnamed protein product [Rotaria sp. Silwood1]CAF4681895.1 unnamed protein product [Rotaria sp. Silwood1]CAF4696350.1 unnamed protein product [Rotaria sp. Silwood1]